MVLIKTIAVSFQMKVVLFFSGFIPILLLLNYVEFDQNNFPYFYEIYIILFYSFIRFLLIIKINIDKDILNINQIRYQLIRFGELKLFLLISMFAIVSFLAGLAGILTILFQNKTEQLSGVIACFSFSFITAPDMVWMYKIIQWGKNYDNNK